MAVREQSFPPAVESAECPTATGIAPDEMIRPSPSTGRAATRIWRERAGNGKRTMKSRMAHAVRVLSFASAGALTIALTTGAAGQDVERGKYLVGIAGCFDCHTPGYFLGKPDMARYLGGSDVGFDLPGLGVFYGPNLTPDKETGLGRWTTDQIVTAIRTGETPDGRILAPVMPWRSFSRLTDQDAMAIAAYLKSLQPVRNKVPGPFGPSEKPTSFVMKVMPPDGSPPRNDP